jgi:hypothetical protein
VSKLECGCDNNDDDNKGDEQEAGEEKSGHKRKWEFAGSRIGLRRPVEAEGYVMLRR